MYGQNRIRTRQWRLGLHILLQQPQWREADIMAFLGQLQNRDVSRVTIFLLCHPGPGRAKSPNSVSNKIQDFCMKNEGLKANLIFSFLHKNYFLL